MTRDKLRREVMLAGGLLASAAAFLRPRAAAAAPAAAQTAPSVEPLHRTALLVADVEASTPFYTEVLGMTMFATESFVPAEMTPQLLRLLGYPGTGSMRFRFFRVGTAKRGWVALFEMKPAAPPAPLIRPSQMSIGEACLVFYYPNLDELMPKLAKHGATIIGGPETLVTTAMRQRELVVRNRDNTLFNLIEGVGAA